MLADVKKLTVQFFMKWVILFSLFFSPALPLFWLGPNRSKLQDMLANLRDVDELPSLQPSVGSPSRPSSSRLPEQEISRADEGEHLDHSQDWRFRVYSVCTQPRSSVSGGWLQLCLWFGGRGILVSGLEYPLIAE